MERKDTENLRRRIFYYAALLADSGRLKEALAAALLAYLLPRGQLADFLASLEEAWPKDLDALGERLERLLLLAPSLPLRKPPPWGWSLLGEVLDLYRPPGGKEEVYRALVGLTHFAPLYRVALARAAWDLFGSYDRPRFEELLLRLYHEAPRLEAQPPLRGKLKRPKRG